jgi:hypothetical protein
MDATTMLLTPLLKQIERDYPQFSFIEADTFCWSAESNTIQLDSRSEDTLAFVLHELGHALLNHQSYNQDIDLLKIERDAWHVATTTLARRYDVTIDDDLVQNNLETYREWLHTRSLCPTCNVNGLQTFQGAYLCLACGCRWKTNEARSCALRRHRL